MFLWKVNLLFTCGIFLEILWPLGIARQITPTRKLLRTWFDVKPINSIQKILLLITLLVICWEIWEGIWSCKYGEREKMACK